jgi:RHS repeat-associated protein
MEGGVSSLRVTRNNIQTIIDDQYGVNTRFVIRKRDMPIEKAGTDLYYLDNLYPNANLDAVRLLTINYYDRYAVPDQGIENLDPQNAPSPIPSQLNYTDDVQGLQTSGKVRVLGTDQWISNASYYDEKGRGIYGGGYNEYLDTHDYTYSVYNFTNQVTQTTSLQEKDGFSIYTTDEFTYDHRGRLLTQTQKINGLISELIVNNKYDELGQLKNKKVGGDVASSPENSSGLQQVDFSYNTRGWMTGINDSNNLGADLFGFNLSYNNPGNSNATPLYNGNISETEWKTEKDNTLRKYVYGYDALNRIKNADYSGGMMESYPNGTPISEDFSVGKISYHRNGNITALQRSGAVLDINSSQVIDVDIIDKLDYHYQPKSNKLLSVGDVAHTEGFKDGNQNGDDYTYDVNGNLTRDKNKGITEITYNHLNLPEKIVFGNAGQMANSNKINYIYTANGTKLEKEVTQLNGNTTQTTTTQYAAGMIYKDGDLEFFAQPEGYVQPNANSGYEYVFQYKDHLGNIRLSYSDSDGNGSIDTSTEIVEENNYYPFGLEHKGYNSNILSEHNWDYQGKEHQKELGLEWHDFGARNYDAALGRWMNVDPLAEKFMGWSPYSAMLNDPINFVDPTGMAAEWIPKVNEDGSTSYIAEAGDDASTLQSQYGLDDGVAEQVIGDKEIKTGDVVSGQDVKDVTGSDVLKLDLNSDLATDQRVFDQYVFGVDHSIAKGDFGFYTTQYYGSVGDQANRLAEGFANLNVRGQSIRVNYSIPLYDTQGVIFNAKQYAYFLNNSSITSNILHGNMFGRYQDMRYLDFPLYLSFGKGRKHLKRQGQYRLLTPESSGNLLDSRFDD